MELHRQLGVTKKTGWRMGQQIRKLISSTNGYEKLMGHVELDEAYVGGRRSGGKRGRGALRQDHRHGHERQARRRPDGD